MTPFLGMVCAFSFPKAPKGWLPCNGQLIPINQNQALFALLGTTYGGDGRTTFALPDLRGRAIAGVGAAPGVDTVSAGEMWGTNNVTLLQSNLPSHSHQVLASGGDATTGNPSGLAYATTKDANDAKLQCYGTSANTAMHPTNVAGGSQPVNVQNPFLAINYCIATQGIFPSRQ